MKGQRRMFNFLGKSRLQRLEALEGYLWISPWIFGFLVFSLGPIVASLYLSFTKYKIGGTPEWIGSGKLYRGVHR